MLKQTKLLYIHMNDSEENLCTLEQDNPEISFASIDQHQFESNGQNCKRIAAKFIFKQKFCIKTSLSSLACLLFLIAVALLFYYGRYANSTKKEVDSASVDSNSTQSSNSTKSPSQAPSVIGLSCKMEALSAITATTGSPLVETNSERAQQYELDWNLDSICLTEECNRIAWDLRQNMDFSVKPCDDFYQFACGNWIKNHPIPAVASASSWIIEDELKVNKRIQTFLESNNSLNGPKAVNEAQLLFRSCMNAFPMPLSIDSFVSDFLKEFNLSNYSPENATEADDKNFDWVETIAAIKRITSLDVIFGLDIVSDPNDNDRKQIKISSPKNYILSEKYNSDIESDREEMKILHETDEKDIHQRKTYQIGAILNSILEANPRVDAQSYKLTKASRYIIYNISKTLKQFKDTARSVKPSVDKDDKSMPVWRIDTIQNATDEWIAPRSLPIWRKYLENVFKEQPTINLNNYSITIDQIELDYLQMVTKFILETPNKDLKLYIWWKIYDGFIGLHSKEFIERIKWDSKPKQAEYCKSKVQSVMIMAISYEIAPPNFRNKLKPQIEQIINNIRKAFNHFVQDITWMDSITKQFVLAKSEAMKSFVGLPEWISKEGKLDEYYAGLDFNESSYMKNLMKVIEWRMNRKLKSLNNIEEDTKWFEKPIEVDAAYAMDRNTMIIPLALLQYPFFNLGLEALNYGAIGVIIGHEFTHGFDSNGREYDAIGAERQWWSKPAISQLNNRTRCFVEEYTKFYTTLGDHINGQTTLGENIADVGGIRQAFYAYKYYTKEYGKERYLQDLGDFSHEQLFFLSFANGFCENLSKEAMKNNLEDLHAPGRFRCNGVLQNLEEFRYAFNCSSDSKMVSKSECRIW